MSVMIELKLQFMFLYMFMLQGWKKKRQASWIVPI
jgi:hypothetical protein